MVYEARLKQWIGLIEHKKIKIINKYKWKNNSN